MLLAAVSCMMFSCSKDEMMSSAGTKAIEFSNAFVNNSTKAIDGSYTNSNFTEFAVYGTITNSSNQTANIFGNEKVTKTDDGNWAYDATKTQYWIPGNKYNFTAIADGNVANATQVNLGANDMPVSLKVLDINDQKDILLAQSEEINFTGSSTASPVAFNFSHLLSKARVTVYNTINVVNSGYCYKISNITLLNEPKSGEYTISTEKWAANPTQLVDVEFKDAVAADASTATAAEYIYIGKNCVSNYERLLIPTTDQGRDIKIQFQYELYKVNGSGNAQTHTLIQSETRTASATGVVLEAGNSYNFKISLGNPGSPIEFSVTEVTGWNQGTNNSNDKNFN